MNRPPRSFGALAAPLSAASGWADPVALARMLIVLGCAAALILAGQPLPL
ncbi:MAG: hypothetical protein NBV60_03785 [Erythrobacter sp.]|nr:hypothetical protein [Erythrobacter sp.]